MNWRWRWGGVKKPQEISYNFWPLESKCRKSNKEQDRENFSQECEELLSQLSFHNQGKTWKLEVTDTKEGKKEPQSLIELPVMSSARTLWTSLYPETNS